MIRLVTQFDRPTARAAVATPTCGGCCCCCCCVVTAAASSIYLAVSAQLALSRARQEAPERVRLGSPFPGLFGFFALPAGIVVMLLGAYVGLEAGIVLFGVAAWYGLIVLAYWGAGHRHPWIRATAVAVAVATVFMIELFAWASTIEVQ